MKPHTAYRLTLVVGICACHVVSVVADDTTLSPGTAAEVAMDDVILKAGVNMMRQAVEEDTIRNVVLLVARNGKVVLHEAIGWKDKENRVPLRKDAMFRMASNTKPLVATAIGMLVEETKLTFDDRVCEHIRAFNNDRSRQIRIRHLLSHTSGLRIKPIFLNPLVPKSQRHPAAPNLQLEVNRFGEIGAAEPVGSSYSYNNAGYNTLGALVEVAAQQPLDLFLNERIYVPLGMSDSYHHEVAEKLDGKIDRMSVVYYRRGGTWTVGWKPGDSPQYPFVRASGGMISTAMDYAIFCQMYLNGGIYNGKRILKDETIREMISPHTRSVYEPDERETMDRFYGFGWSVFKDGNFFHAGSDGTAAWVDPNHNLIVIVFTQSPGDKTTTSRFFDLVQTSIRE